MNKAPFTKKFLRDLLKRREEFLKAKKAFEEAAEVLKLAMIQEGIGELVIDGAKVKLIEGTRLKPNEEILKEKFPTIYRDSLSPNVQKIKALAKAGKVSITELVEGGGLKEEKYYQLRIS